ncbi:MAG: FAD:protein FMN transferase [Elusimicrobiota bacterium]
MNLNKKTASTAFLALALSASAFGATSQRTPRVRWVMGTLCEIDAPGAPDALVGAAFAEIERWDRVLSLYKENSDASALNRASGTGPVEVSVDLYAAVEASLRLARETAGAFDPTMLPVLRGSPAQLPLVGWSQVRLDAQGRTIELPAGMGLDFGGIGKGWALDKAAAGAREARTPSSRTSPGPAVSTRRPRRASRPASASMSAKPTRA